MTRTPTLALAALLGASLSASTGASQAKVQEAKTPDPATVRSMLSAMDNEPDPAVLKAMKNQVFLIKHCNAERLRSVLKPLSSGVPGALLSAQSSSDLNAISVRDFPSNLAAIEAAIHTLDVPTAPQATLDVDLQIQVLFASRQTASQEAFPPDLEAVVHSLRSTLGFRSYVLAATLSQRVHVNRSQERFFQGSGQIDGSALGLGSAKGPRSLAMEWGLQGVDLESSPKEPALFTMRMFRFTLKDSDLNKRLADLDTGLTLKEGEHVVVGTSVVEDHGVIVVLSFHKVS